MIEKDGPTGSLMNLQRELQKRSYHPQAICRVMVPKPSSKEKCY
jgi:hypothetical protein